MPTIPPFILRFPGVWSIPTSGPLHTPHLASQLLSLLVPFQLTRGFLKEAFSACLFLSVPLPGFFPYQPHHVTASDLGWNPDCRVPKV